MDTLHSPLGWLTFFWALIWLDDICELRKRLSLDVCQQSSGRAGSWKLDRCSTDFATLNEISKCFNVDMGVFSLELKDLN